MVKDRHDKFNHPDDEDDLKRALNNIKDDDSRFVEIKDNKVIRFGLYMDGKHEQVNYRDAEESVKVRKLSELAKFCEVEEFATNKKISTNEKEDLK